MLVYLFWYGRLLFEKIVFFTMIFVVFNVMAFRFMMLCCINLYLFFMVSNNTHAIQVNGISKTYFMSGPVLCYISSQMCCTNNCPVTYRLPCILWVKHSDPICICFVYQISRSVSGFRFKPEVGTTLTWFEVFLIYEPYFWKGQG